MKKELVAAPEVVLLVIGEVYSRIRQTTGHEVIFAFNKDMFLIAKNEELILGNRNMVINCCAKDLQQKTCGVVKDFGLTYDTFHKMEMKPMSFKGAVHRAAEWLGLPL